MHYFQDKIITFLGSTWGKLQSHESLIPMLVWGVIIAVALVMWLMLLPTVSNRDN